MENLVARVILQVNIIKKLDVEIDFHYQARVPRTFLVFGLFSLVACAPLDAGPDYPRDASSGDVFGVDAPRANVDAPSTPFAPLSADGFFCFVQPLVFSPHRCASDNGCHAERSALRLDPEAETIQGPTCVDGVPTTPVPASYYTNLARSRGEVRSTASSSDLYTRPIGRDHPVDLFGTNSEEARLLRRWIEGG